MKDNIPTMKLPKEVEENVYLQISKILTEAEKLADLVVEFVDLKKFSFKTDKVSVEINKL